MSISGRGSRPEARPEQTGAGHDHSHLAPTRRLATSGRVAGAGVLAAAAGAVVLYGYGALVVAVGVPMRAGDPGADAAVPIGPANFSIGVLVCTFWGTVLAVALALWAARPARTFVRTTAVLVAVSLVAPLLAVDTAVSTKIALMVGHVVAALVVVPLMTRALPPRRG